MSKTALVALANGAEEIEFVAPVDILRRAGVTVVVASVEESLTVKLAQGVSITADKALKDVGESEIFDVIILPGGLKGSENCRDTPHLINMLKAQNSSGRWIAAICAAPVIVLAYHGFLDEVKAVCYPSLQKQLKNKGEGRVCVDKNFITSLGPGSAMEFGYEILHCLLGEHAKNKVVKLLCTA